MITEIKRKWKLVSGRERFFVLNDPWTQVYCSIWDFAPGVKVNIRYAKLAKVCTVTV